MERLDKLIANASTLSRKEVHRLIKSGGVSVNGIITKDRGFCIDPDTARVCVGGRELSLQKYTYLMLNKPQGIVSAARDDKEKTVVDLVPEQYKKKNLFPAGRLDKDTTGFILLTDNGDFAHRILSPKNHIKKTYHARLSSPVGDDALAAIEQGITLGDGTVCMPADIKILEGGETPLVEIIICEGKYHQIKRMFAASGSSVTALKRVAMGALWLDNSLNPGECRPLTQSELELIESK